jgi:hypothetical protein
MFRLNVHVNLYGSTIKLIGNLMSEHVSLIAAQLRLTAPPITLDLAELTSTDRDAIRFLLGCEQQGMTLLHCSPFVRAKIEREQASPT